jgi:uncharacterized alkaline shock family protein YloU
VKVLGYFDRVILAIYTISLGLVSLALIAIAVAGWGAPLDFLRTSAAGVTGRVGFAFVGIVLLVVSVRLTGVGIAGSPRRRAIVHSLSMGDVRVSVHAIEGMVQRLVRNVAGVRDAKALIENWEEGLSVRVRATVGPETPIADLAATIQDAIQTQVQRVVGIAVVRVRVEIDHISPETRRGRVE